MKCYNRLISHKVPQEPLLCKFADGGQKKRQSQGKYLQNGRVWTREGDTVRLDYLCSNNSADSCIFIMQQYLAAAFADLCTQLVFLIPQGGMTLTYDPTPALQNGSVFYIYSTYYK